MEQKVIKELQFFNLKGEEEMCRAHGILNKPVKDFKICYLGLQLSDVIRFDIHLLHIQTR